MPRRTLSPLISPQISDIIAIQLTRLFLDNISIAIPFSPAEYGLPYGIILVQYHLDAQIGPPIDNRAFQINCGIRKVSL